MVKSVVLLNIATIALSPSWMKSIVSEFIYINQTCQKCIKEFSLIHILRCGRAQRNMCIKKFDDTFHMFADSPSVGQDYDYIKPNS